ncbi:MULTISPECIES: molybdopterin-guanine dinucleotide biosynthesis protein B [Bacillus]|uniref:molybdopterin-guanine dinucleotide biosynthesis protein B n=1 Tax=Bacillus TaxID=1386 RepID=UPI000BB7C88A|nr:MULTISPECIES: molybdopterin-guanine dinucleotide biosynthesis protein B [Bacillus]
MKVIQIVGFQNSGKTTLVENVIRRLTCKGLEVATIKHHGHGGAPDYGPRRDSLKHMEAGSTISTVEGSGGIQLVSNSRGWNLERILSFYKFLGTETVIVEGYKREKYPKIVILRSKQDLHLLKELSDIIAVVVWGDLEIKEEIPVFHITDTEKLLEWIGKEVDLSNGKNV